MSPVGALLAHAAPISYKFPLPIWLYVLAGGAVVLLSAPAAALAVRGARADWSVADADLYPIVRRLRWGRSSPVIGALLVAVAFAGGLFSTTEQSTRVLRESGHAAHVGRLLGRARHRLLARRRLLGARFAAQRRGTRTRPSARPQGCAAACRTPSVSGSGRRSLCCSLWSWLELIWGHAKEPRTLALILLGYVVATLAGCGVFGAETWLGNVELFSVFARTLSRFSPLELRPFVPEEWASTTSGTSARRGFASYGAGLRTDPPLPRRRRRVRAHHARHGRLRRLVADRPVRLVPAVVLRPLVVPRAPHRRAADALDARGVVVVFVGAYLLVTRGKAAVLAPTLIPIAAVYFTAHYFAYLLIAGEDTPAVLVDPFGHSWNPLGWGEYELWRGIAPAGLVWWLQVLRDRVGPRRGGVRRTPSRAPRLDARSRALLAQAPLVLLMVLYTTAGLWVLAQQLKA